MFLGPHDLAALAQQAAPVTAIDLMSKPAAAAMEAQLREAFGTCAIVTGEGGGCFLFTLDQGQECLICPGAHATSQYRCRPLIGSAIFKVRHVSDSDCSGVYGWQGNEALASVRERPKGGSGYVGLIQTILESCGAELACDGSRFYLWQGTCSRKVAAQVVKQVIHQLSPVLKDILADVRVAHCRATEGGVFLLQQPHDKPDELNSVSGRHMQASSPKRLLHYVEFACVLLFKLCFRRFQIWICLVLECAYDLLLRSLFMRLYVVLLTVFRF